jgi:MazG family protein
VLHAQVAKDNGQFDIEDVAAAINAKMVKRHPHVFSDVSLGSAQEVVKQWADLKSEERNSVARSAMDGIPAILPALFQALKVSEKAVEQGFEWRNEGELWDKLHSEIAELKEALAHPDLPHRERGLAARKEMELELGDVLFTLVNIGRWHSSNAEEALLLAIEKFKRRFRTMEEMAERPLKELSFAELDQLWESAKATLRKECTSF